MSPLASSHDGMQDRTIVRAWLLYSIHKKTLSECAALLWPETQYASEVSCRQAIWRQFRHLDLPLRPSHPRPRKSA